MIVSKPYRVQIRQDLAPVKPEAMRLDGHVFLFTEGWTIGDDFEGDLYKGEKAILMDDPRAAAEKFGYDIPMWMASGDLIAVEEHSA